MEHNRNKSNIHIAVPKVKKQEKQKTKAQCTATKGGKIGVTCHVER